ncbi:class I mannose-6-phosphate isomerase [Acrocarpospora catenulata]|uniref:class I mannose-6-phosphate isomerase n=1 Tax=Acrocarpospora catenulata TaxID=2836182 RepID=UPI001BDA5735|nr:class I mannose-6-phosphate isomerase [Acrocarpospora catenulata]
MNSRPAPLLLADNRIPVYYAGGERISEFRGGGDSPTGPEDWVGSLTALPAALLPPGYPQDTGVSRTDRGSLRDLVKAAPQAWLGEELAAAHGAESGLLVKLLDAGERLPVHCHPTRDFARAHLGSRFGKTEGWIVLAAAPGARVWLGLRERVAAEELRRWITAQDSTAMLAAMNEIPVTAGQVFYVPAGLPHAIGAGVMVTELQEPTSFSVLAEHDAFGLGSAAATLGLGWDLALTCFDLNGYADRLGELMPASRDLRSSSGGRLRSLFPADADAYFRAWQAECTEDLALPGAGFAVLVVTGGAGTLVWNGGETPIARGQTLVVPAAAGPLCLRGTVRVIACLPPEC